MVRHLIKRGAIAGAALIGVEFAYAVLRPAPFLEQFDPSGKFGDPSHPVLKVVVLGDSSVTAPGVAGPEESWISLVAERLAVGRHVVVDSLAVGGSCAHDLVLNQLRPAIELNPDIVFVAVGANDVIRGVSLRRFEANLDHLVDELNETGATIFLSGLGDLGSIPRLVPPLRQMFTQRSAAFDRIHRKVAARRGAHVIPQRADQPELWYRDRELWAADLFHVSAAGHRRWADSTWATVEPTLAALHGTR
jgi:lysophospholipase L1-like esterase